MTFLLRDRVRETSTTEGTGTYSLLGAAAGFRTFGSAVGIGNTTTYVATMGSQWEVAIGTVASGTLARTTILASSNSNNAVNWTAGTKDLRVDVTADFATQMLRGAVRWGGTSAGTVNAQTLTLSPAITEYWAGLMIVFIAGLTNTDEITINANSVGAEPLLSFIGEALSSGDILTNASYLIAHDGFDFRVLVSLGDFDLAALEAEIAEKVDAAGAEAAAESYIDGLTGAHDATTALLGNNTFGALNPAAASQAEAEAGTEAALRSWSPLRVGQAIAALASAATTSPFGTMTGSQAGAASGASWKITGNATAIPITNGWFAKVVNTSGSSKTITPASGSCVRVETGDTAASVTIGNNKSCLIHGDGTNLIVDGDVS